jgi:N-acetylneuraminic acid mutarotase
MPTARFQLGAALADDNKIYAIGGFTGFPSSGSPTPLTTVERFDPAANAWTTGPNLPSGIAVPGSVAGKSGGVLFSVGGYGPSGQTTSVESLDVALAFWSPVQNMPQARYGHCAVTAAEGSIYVVGGTVALSGPTQLVQSFDPKTNTWVSLGSMWMARAYGAAAIDSTIGVLSVGGTGFSGTTSTAEVYDTTSNVSRPVAAGSAGRQYLNALTAPDGTVYAIGGMVFGSSGGTSVALVEAYDPLLDTWQTKASLGTARDGAAASIGPDGRIFVVGGETNSVATGSVEAYGPVSALTPNSGAPGTTITVSGSNFAASTTVQVYWGDAVTGTLVATSTTDGSGNLASTTFQVPAGATSGAAKVTVVDFGSIYAVTPAFSVP